MHKLLYILSDFQICSVEALNFYYNYLMDYLIDYLINYTIGFIIITSQPQKSKLLLGK